MHVGITWREKRSRHSLRMRNRGFTYLIRGQFTESGIDRFRLCAGPICRWTTPIGVSFLRRFRTKGNPSTRKRPPKTTCLFDGIVALQCCNAMVLLHTMHTWVIVWVKDIVLHTWNGSIGISCKLFNSSESVRIVSMENGSKKYPGQHKVYFKSENMNITN